MTPNKKPQSRRPYSRPAAPRRDGFARQASEATTLPTAANKLRIIPLGGLEEVGKNMTAFEYGNDIVIVDMGLMFPNEDMPGVDYVVPDVTYLQKKAKNIRGLLITHGHLDHIGAIPYLIEKIGMPPVFATKLTAGLMNQRLAEFGLEKRTRVTEFHPDDKLNLGVFSVSFFRVTHSIPDCVGIAIKTPLGTIVHTGDFKVDHTPVDQQPMEFHKISQLGHEGVLLLLSESTNAWKDGYSISEKTIGKNILNIVEQAPGRVVIATFASLISRIQQIVNAAVLTGRKLSVSGRSVEQNLELAVRLGYIKMPKDTYVSINKVDNYPDNKVIILATGSQGQDNSSLSRMSRGEHKHVKIRKGDLVVISSSPIPGNERAVQTLMDALFRAGAMVNYNRDLDIHTSGHGYRKDLELMLALVKPKYFIPIHGQRYMLEEHKLLAKAMGVFPENIFVMQNGAVLEIDKHGATISKTSVPAGYVMVDGLGVGDIGNVVLRDRKVMAEDGMVVVLVKIDDKTNKLVGEPDIITRGFIYVKSSDRLLFETKQKIRHTIIAATSKTMTDKMEDWNNIRGLLRDDLSDFFFKETERRPMILPVIIKV
ncbi:MAG: ribonuclease J [Patescibacteria group bacterium]